MGPRTIFTAGFHSPRRSVLAAGLAVAVLATGCSNAEESAVPKTTESAAPAAGEATGRTTAQAESADNSALSSAAMNSGDVEKLVPKVLATHPFSPESFTQGLEFDDDGSLLVGTGQWGQSRIYRANLADHSIAEHAELADEFFGEGITRSGDIIWQLTWQAGEAIARDPHTLAETTRVHYDGEGWGICAREGELLVSDGSDTISKRDPVTFAPRAGEELRVTAAGTPVGKINELECVGDDVYANIFLSDEIIRFSAETGEVDAVIDASDLENNATADPNHVLNGIAFQESTGHFFVTGKRWPDLYEVEFVPAG